MSARTVLLYDYDPAGHHPQWLARCGEALASTGAQVVLAGPINDERVRHFRQSVPEGPRIRWVESKCPPGRHDRSGPLGLLEAEKLRRLHGADHVFFPYLDAVIGQPLQAAAWNPDWPARLHGIWMGPRPLEPGWIWRTPFSGFARGVRRQQKGLARLKGEKRLGWLGVLDPSLVDAKGLIGVADTVCWLPDPAEPLRLPERNAARAQWGIPENLTVFLHFGTDESRKGLLDAAQAMAGLSVDRPCLLLRAGAVGQKKVLHEQLRLLTAQGRLMLIDRFIEEAEIPQLLAACDWVLLPYRNHRDSSGVLSLASCAKRGVVASDYGLIGRRVRAFGSGLLFKHRSTAMLQDALRKALSANAADFEPALAADAAVHNLAAFQTRLSESWAAIGA